MVCGGVALFVLIFGIVLVVDSVHTINEGMVGIYFIHGALHERVKSYLSYSFPLDWANKILNMLPFGKFVLREVSYYSKVPI